MLAYILVNENVRGVVCVNMLGGTVDVKQSSVFCSSPPPET